MMLFDAITVLRDYWRGLNKSTEDTLDGFIFSLFSMFDGVASCNDFSYIILKDGKTALNKDNYLHELWVGYCQENNEEQK